MQGDHLLSAAGVSEQAGGPGARTCTPQPKHTHAHTEDEACQHTCANRGVRRDHSLRSQPSRSSFYAVVFLGGFFNSACLSNVAQIWRCGVTAHADTFYASRKHPGLSSRSSCTGIIRQQCGGGIKLAASP